MNGKIYVGQTLLTLKISLDVDISDAITTIIKYIKPNKDTGFFTAQVENESCGVIKYIVLNNTDLDIPGKWTFWAHLTYSGAREIASTPTVIEVFKEGK